MVTTGSTVSTVSCCVSEPTLPAPSVKDATTAYVPSSMDGVFNDHVWSAAGVTRNGAAWP